MFSLVFWSALLPLAALHARANARTQRLLLLVAGLTFYGSIDPRLLLVLTGVVITSWLPIRAAHYTDDRAMLGFVRLAAAILAFLPLVAARLSDDAVMVAGRLASAVSPEIEPWVFSGLVPVGAAFYTLQAVNAIYDTAGDRHKPGFVDHLLFVSFLPTIVVGPVQRHELLGPQLRRRRRVDVRDIDAAARYLIFGAFWKLVVADNLLPIADRVFADPQRSTGPSIVLAAVAFAVGITGDLAGYSAVAVGGARLFGVRLPSINVDRPYLARSPLGFWNRWLTSVTDWMRERIHAPLARRGRGAISGFVALATTFAVGTWWHGGRPPLIVWGALHFLAVLAQLEVRRRRAPSPSRSMAVVKTASTFGFVCYTWIWFQSSSIADALILHRRLVSVDLDASTIGTAFTVLMFTALLFLSDHAFDRLTTLHLNTVGPPPGWPALAPVRGAVYALLAAGMLLLATVDLHPSVLGLL